MNKTTFLTLILTATIGLGLSVSAKANIIDSTLPEYNGPPNFDFNEGSPDYPLAPVTIGTFTITIPTGYVVVGGTISGFFGNDDISSTTAASDYFVDNGAIEVASCDDALNFVACDSTATSPTPWSYTFTSADLTALAPEIAAGSVDFSVVQNYAISVQTGTTTLELVAAPEPATVFVFCGGLAGIALRRRFRKS